MTEAWAGKHSVVLATVGAVALLSPGCASPDEPSWRPPPPGERRSTVQPPPAASAAVVSSSARSAGSGPGKAYRLGRGDVVRIGLRDVEEIGATTEIRSPVGEYGRIALPLIGEVQAAGKSPGGLRRAIRDRLASRFVRDPFVTVEVYEYRSKRLSIFGSVEEPGAKFLQRNYLTVLEALALAGGRTEVASHRAIVACPHLAEQRGSLRVGIDLYALAQGDTRQNIVLHPDDTLRVPEAGRVFVAGYAEEPGAYPYRRGMTALRAVATAGGYQIPTASPSLTRVRRETPEGGIRFIDVDLTAVAHNEAPDVPLQPGDVVEVRQGTLRWLGLGFYEFTRGIVGLGFDIGRFLF